MLRHFFMGLALTFTFMGCTSFPEVSPNQLVVMVFERDYENSEPRLYQALDIEVKANYQAFGRPDELENLSGEGEIFRAIPISKMRLPTRMELSSLSIKRPGSVRELWEIDHEDIEEIKSHSSTGVYLIIVLTKKENIEAEIYLRKSFPFEEFHL